ncbi:MAG: PucR family transcriptional regulator [Janibacter sp.]
MLVPLPEVLALPSFRAAEATVVTGDTESAMVRWVHSSEVNEMGNLLAGGEVLLSTGLGLHGRSAEQLETYVETLADAGCVALVLELGRSLFTLPEPIRSAARRRNLIVVTLDAVVPFERMAEDFHELLLQRKLGATRNGEAMWRGLLSSVVAGQGMGALLDEISRTAGCPVELIDAHGDLVERSHISSVDSSDPAQVVAADVRDAAGLVGQLVLRGGRTQRRTALVERASVAVALEMGRHPTPGQYPSPAQSVIADLAAGKLTSAGDVQRRLHDAGVHLSTGQHLVAVAVATDARAPAVEAVPAVTEAFTQVAGPVLAGAVGNAVIVLMRTPSAVATTRALVSDAAALLPGPVAGSKALVGVSDATAHAADLATAVDSAREVVRCARRVGVAEGVRLARDVSLQQLLDRLDARLLNDFVAGQIGPLIEHDRAHAADLVRTLDMFLSAGLSKADTARGLGIRRQSLYDRIGRIERLLGVDLGQRGHISDLSVALIAWRMRTGLDPQSAFERSPHARW